MPGLSSVQLLGRLPWFAPLFLRAFFLRAFFAISALPSLLSETRLPIVVGPSARAGPTRAGSVI